MNGIKAPGDRKCFRNDLITSLEQGRGFVDDIGDESYVRSLPDLQLSAIGDHFRHQLDYIDAFLRGLDAGCIDYADRRRDRRIATDPKVALEATTGLVERLQRLDVEALDDELCVVQRNNPGEDRRPSAGTTPGREFAFLISHTVHHYAIISIVARSLGISPPDEFGVMPSTLRHRRSVKQKSEQAAE